MTSKQPDPSPRQLFQQFRHAAADAIETHPKTGGAPDPKRHAAAVRLLLDRIARLERLGILERLEPWLESRPSPPSRP